MSEQRKPRRKAKRPNRKGRNPSIPESLTIARELRAFELDQRGFTQREIAEQLSQEFDTKISQPAVCKALQRIHRDTLAEMTATIAQQKGRQVSRLEGIYFESMRSWRASLAGSKKTSQKRKKRTLPGSMVNDKGEKVPVPVDAGTEEETRLEQLAKHGEPRFLETARAALGDIRQVLGLNAPTKNLNLDLPPGDPTAEMSDEALEREIAAAEARIEAMTQKVLKTAPPAQKGTTGE